MKIKYIRLKDKEHVCDYWLILAYRSLLQRTRKSRKRKEFARRIIRLSKGSQVLDENRGLVGTVVSESPFICGCEMCIRVDFGKGSDVYACTYFAK